MTMTVANLLLLAKGTRFPVTRPKSLTTDWAWRVVEALDPSEVVDSSASLITNSTRHQLIDIDERYSVDVEYEIQIMNDIGATVSFGSFQICQAVFGPDDAVNFYELNAQLKLAVGLAGLNTRVVNNTADPVTGIPMDATIYIYTDETLTRQLAQYRILRSLNAVGQVIGEIMFREMYDPSAIPACPSENSEPSGT